jgi:hypothetical protein
MILLARKIVTGDFAGGLAHLFEPLGVGEGRYFAPKGSPRAMV